MTRESRITSKSQMDPIWSVFEGAPENQEEFVLKYMPELYLKPEVHADVVEKFRVVRRLVEQSYSEYKFFDVAARESLQAMETALRIRYQELNGISGRIRMSLYEMIQWFEEHNYFESDHPEYMDSMRKIRNVYAHPVRENFSGPMTAPLIEKMVDIINGLYEDPALRIDRKKLDHHISNAIKSFGGRMVYEEEGKRYLVFNAWPGFINNKNNALEIHFYYKPCYVTGEGYLKSNEWMWSPVHYFRARQVEILPDKIILQGYGHTLLILEKVSDPREIVAFENWEKKYGEVSNLTGELINGTEGPVDPFFMHLRDFHRI